MTIRDEAYTFSEDDKAVIRGRVEAKVAEMDPAGVYIHDQDHPQATIRMHLTRYYEGQRIEEIRDRQRQEEELERKRREQDEADELEISKAYGQGIFVFIGEEELRSFAHSDDVRCPRCGEPVDGIGPVMLEAWRYRRAALRSESPADKLPKEFTHQHACRKCGETRLVSVAVMP